VVTVTPDRKVGSFSVVKPSGDATFDAEVAATLARIQASGAELPAPPPMYPDMLRQSLPVGFQCTVQKLCE
jgi:outer membrane biosynthesis protein TonB